MTLEFLEDATNVVLVGPNGVGKSMIAQNLAHQAVTRGHTVLFTSAGQLLGTSARSTATPRYAAGCATTPTRICSSSTRSAISPTPIDTPT